MCYKKGSFRSYVGNFRSYSKVEAERCFQKKFVSLNKMQGTE